MKAVKELDEWEERSRKERDEVRKQKAPRLTMSVLMQSRASFSNCKALGVDKFSAEIVKTLTWRALHKIKSAF